MADTTPTDLRANLAAYLDLAQTEAIEVRSRNVRRRAVIVSTRFYDHAKEALGDRPYNPPPLTLAELWEVWVAEDRQLRGIDGGPEDDDGPAASANDSPEAGGGA